MHAQPSAGGSRRRVRRRERGFTLTELMVVVALVGVLATVGIASFRRQVSASKTTESASVIQAIRAAEEAYRAENQVYLNVSSKDAWYPSGQFGATVSAWGQPAHADYARWQRLGVNVTQPVQFGYLVNAGNAGDAVTALHLDSNPNLGTPKDVWYVIQARADYDGDGQYCNAAATSFSPELYIENEGE